MVYWSCKKKLAFLLGEILEQNMYRFARRPSIPEFPENPENAPELNKMPYNFQKSPTNPFLRKNTWKKYTGIKMNFIMGHNRFASLATRPCTPCNPYNPSKASEKAPGNFQINKISRSLVLSDFFTR